MKRYVTSLNMVIRHLSSSSLPPESPPLRLFEDKWIDLLLSCNTPRALHQVHAQLVVHGIQHHDYISPKLVTIACELKDVFYARKVFDRNPEPNVPTWNAMLKVYSQNEMHGEVVALFRDMRRMGALPNCFTFPIVFKSCSKTRAFVEAGQVHSGAIKFGFLRNPFVVTALIDMYSELGAIECAFKAFSELHHNNVVACTSMINAYLSCSDIDSARRLFDSAPERDIILWNTMISGYIESEDMAKARNLFNQMPNRDIMSWNTLLIGYANNGNVESLAAFFEEIPERNIFSWNGLMSGYARNQCFSQVLSTFKQMLIESNVSPTDATIMTVLSATARIRVLDVGTSIHAYAEKTKYASNIYVGNALIDMYAKCGFCQSAVNIFTNMKRKDLVSWNTVISALAVHGQGAEALKYFNEMKHDGLKLDGITFLGVLSACTHMGLVDEGFRYFNAMIEDHAIVPRIEHYGCMVDLLSRAGLLVEAVNFVNKMSVEADAVIWTNLLGASKIYKNVDVAELCFERLIELEPRNSAHYVMLSSIYGDIGRWGDVARLKLAMKNTGVRKIPGCSSIETADYVIEFYSLDERRPENDEIYGVLNGLTKLIRSSLCAHDLKEREPGVECIDGEESC